MAFLFLYCYHFYLLAHGAHIFISFFFAQIKKERSTETEIIKKQRVRFIIFIFERICIYRDILFKSFSFHLFCVAYVCFSFFRSVSLSVVRSLHITLFLYLHTNTACFPISSVSFHFLFVCKSENSFYILK